MVSKLQCTEHNYSKNNAEYAAEQIPEGVQNTESGFRWLLGPFMCVFREFAGPRPDSVTFHSLENLNFKFHDFPGSVHTRLYVQIMQNTYQT